ncbi:MAG: hypothetical protein EP336_14340 [Rhodobacteraceae bacterium]|nr:MAG: hypothetical protein EP336_14340 [Paracoccaceae bacterium]
MLARRRFGAGGILLSAFVAFHTVPQIHSFFQLRASEHALSDMTFQEVEHLGVQGRRVLCLMSHGDDGRGRIPSFCERMFEAHAPSDMIVVSDFESNLAMTPGTLDLNGVQVERLRTEARQLPDGRVYQEIVSDPETGQGMGREFEVILRLSTLAPEENDRLHLTSSQKIEAYDLSVKDLPVARFVTGDVKVHKGWFWFIGDAEKIPRSGQMSANVWAFLL